MYICTCFQIINVNFAVSLGDSKRVLTILQVVIRVCQ